MGALGDTLEKKEAQLNEVLTASNLDPSALSVVTRKLEVIFYNNNNENKENLVNWDVFFIFRMFSTLKTVLLKTCNTNWLVYAKRITICCAHTKLS